MVRWLEHGANAIQLSNRQLAEQLLTKVHAPMKMDTFEGALVEEAADRLLCPRLVPMWLFRWWRRTSA